MGEEIRDEIQVYSKGTQYKTQIQFLTSTWPHVSQTCRVGHWRCKTIPTNTHILLWSSSNNPDPADQVLQMNLSCASLDFTPKSDLCQVELVTSVSFSLMTSSPWPNNVVTMMRSRAPYDHLCHKFIFSRESKEANSRLCDLRAGNLVGLCKLIKTVKKYKYRASQSDIQSTFLLITVL